MKARYLQPVLAVVLALVTMLAASPVGAAEKAAAKPAPGDVASIWVIWTKDGQTRQFEQAIKDYAAWRKSAGEAFSWQIYQPVAGSDMTHYVIRSGEHHWKDMDTNEAWSMQQQAGSRFDEKVGPYVKRYEHYFTEADSKHSHWIDSKDYRYFGVSHYQFKPGTRTTVQDVMDKVQKAVVDEKWPYPYEIESVIGGRGGTNIVEPMKSYADMADPDPSLAAILAKSLGSKQAATAAMTRFGTSIEDYRFTLYVYRPDLSTPK
jgi:hypothetical protein